MRRLHHLVTVPATAILCSCVLTNPTNSSAYVPSRLPIGPLTISVWLPAGMGEEIHLGPADQQRLVDLGINQLQWVQRAADPEGTAEEQAMAFCSRAGLHMPVYFEARGYSPYDKLRNWATRTQVSEGFADSVRARVRALRQQWNGSPGFGGYLIGHEDYRHQYYAALSQTVAALQEEDPGTPAFVVGSMESLPKRGRFLDAFFTEGTVANVFQHEHYVFRAGLPASGRVMRQRLDDLVSGYGVVARSVQERNGRWHAIVQVHGEIRDDEVYYRHPSAEEIRVQVGLAMARGASGIVYFLYSSGIERVLDGDGEVRQVRRYEGLVGEDRVPTSRYHAARQINLDLSQLAPHLEALHFHGGYSSGRLPSNDLVISAEPHLDLGFFGDGAAATHVLIVSLQTETDRTAHLVIHTGYARDEVTGQELTVREGGIAVPLAAGGFRLLRLVHTD